MTDDNQDIVERLDTMSQQRLLSEPRHDPQHAMAVYARISREDGALMLEAKAIIEAQAAEIERLRAALGQYVGTCEWQTPNPHCDRIMNGTCCQTALAALNEKGPGDD